MVSSGPIWYMFHDNLDTAFLLTGQNNVWLQATLTVLYCPITLPCQCSGHTRVCCNQPWAVCISLTQSLGWSRHRIYAPIRCKCPTSKSKIWRKRVLIIPLVQPATALHSERRNNDRMKSGLLSTTSAINYHSSQLPSLHTNIYKTRRKTSGNDVDSFT